MPTEADDEDEEWDDWLGSGLPADHSIEVHVTENPVVGVIYGPDGEVLTEVRERPVRPYGFARWREEDHG